MGSEQQLEQFMSNSGQVVMKEGGCVTSIALLSAGQRLRDEQ